MRVLVKIGGAALETSAGRTELALAVKTARAAGHELILVHGGGKQIKDLAARLGLPEERVEGLRVTDEATAEVVVATLAGTVNRTLVASLQAHGVSAVGLCGADAGTFSARPWAEGAQGRPDIGYVGEVDHVNPGLVQALLEVGHLPTIATVAPREGAPGDEPFYNINADHGAGPLAHAFQADALLFLTDVPGVLHDGQLVPTLSASEAEQLRKDGVLQGGMLPKVEAALGCAAAAPKAKVKIAPSAGVGAIVEALDDTVGTRVLPPRPELV